MQNKHFSRNKKYDIRDTLYEKRATILTIAALVLVVFTYFYLRLTVLNFGNTLNFYGGDNEYTRSLAIRLFTFAKVLWIYLGLLLWPNPLHMERTVDLVKSFWSGWVLGMLGLIIGLVFVGIKRMDLAAGRQVLFGLFWFLVMLVPSSGIIPINGILYEHWLYIPMVGFWIMIYGILGLISENSDNTQKVRKSESQSFRLSGNPEIRKTGSPSFPSILNRVVLSLAILISFLYILLTIRQNNIWSDPIVFYRYTLQFAPDSARLHNNLALSLGEAGDNKAALAEYLHALQLGSNYPQIYNNIGNTYLSLGNYDLSEKYLKIALNMSPKFGVARINLIKLYVAKKEFDKAIETSQGNQDLIQAIRKAENN